MVIRPCSFAATIRGASISVTFWSSRSSPAEFRITQVKTPKIMLRLELIHLLNGKRIKPVSDFDMPKILMLSPLAYKWLFEFWSLAAADCLAISSWWFEVTGRPLWSHSTCGYGCPSATGHTSVWAEPTGTAIGSFAWTNSFARSIRGGTEKYRKLHRVLAWIFDCSKERAPGEYGSKPKAPTKLQE